MHIVTYNIQYSLGRDGRYDLGRSIAAVRDGDIIALQEVERNWQRSGMADQPAQIGELLPDRYWVYGAPFDVDASSRAADGRIVNSRRQFGQMIVSRWPILSSRTHILPKLHTVERYNMVTGALEAVIATPSGPLRVYSVHLGHIAATERLTQIDRLLSLLHSTPREGGAWNGTETDAAHWESDFPEPPMPGEMILLGDFNAEPRSAEYEELVGPFDPAAGRMIIADRLVDAWVAAGNDETAGVTFLRDPAQGAPHDQRIDYCFVSAGLAPGVRRCWIDGAANGSDHQPVWVDLDPSRSSPAARS